MNRRKNILIGCAVTVAILIGAGIIHHHRLKGAVERYKAELCAQGELLTIKECLPPSVPAESNGAALFRSVTTNFVYNGALATNRGDPMIMVTPGRAMCGWAQPWFGDGSVGWFSNSWADALADLGNRRSEIEQLEQLGVAAAPALQFATNYADGWFSTNSEIMVVSEMKNAAQLLSAAAQCELHQGNMVDAAKRLHAELAILQGTTENRWLITQLVRAVMTEMAAASTWALLQSKDLTETDLRLLQQRWIRLEFMEAMGESFQMERALGLQAYREMRRSRKRFDRFAEHLFALHLPLGQTEGETPFVGIRKGWGRLKLNSAYFVWRYWWSYTDELSYLQQSQNGMEQCRAAIVDGHGLRSLAVYREFSEGNPTDEESFDWGAQGYKGLRSIIHATWHKALERALRAETTKQLATTAIALQRYHLKNEAYPGALSELLPEYLDQPPIDTMDGEPLRYRFLGTDDFLLYSVGANRIDEEGDPRRPSNEHNYAGAPQLHARRDRVWPQPATADEVLAHWEQEIEENYSKLFTPESEIDPSIAVHYEAWEPMLDPETGEPVRDPETGRVILASNPEDKAREWKENIERVARQWTEQYFRTLTNAAINAASF